MFLIRLPEIDPLLKEIFLLTLIADEADVKFTSLMFSIIASHSSCFVATLQMSYRFFAHYSIDHNHSSRISLHSFHNAMSDGRRFFSMTIHVLETSLMILRFETSRYVSQLRRELTLSPSKEEDVDEVDYEKYFSIKSRDFRRIITDLSIFQDDPICVTLTDSQVKFSIATEEIILTEEARQCEIVGYTRDVETQFQITLHPIYFFLDLAHQAKRIWFFKAYDSRNVISVPFGFYAHHLIYFPRT